MGACRIEVTNMKLENVAVYENLAHLKSLYGMLDYLLNRSERGDAVATAIYLDLSMTLDEGTTPMTDIQLDCVRKYYIEGYTLQEIAEMKNRSHMTVNENIHGGIKRAQKALLDGSLYFKGENAE